MMSTARPNPYIELTLVELEFLPDFLTGAGLRDNLCSILFTFDYLQTKLERIGIQSLINDYQWPRKMLGQDRTEKFQSLDHVQRALQASQHILERDPSQLAAQLVGRLSGLANPEVQDLVFRAKRWPGRAWLCPRSASLSALDNVLQRTLEGHTNNVLAIAVTQTYRGEWAVSASADGTLKVWDLETGALKWTLEGHQGNVTSVAVSGNGRTAVSGSVDATIRVWDLTTGELINTIFTDTDGVLAVAITADGKLLISGSGLRGTEALSPPTIKIPTIKIWNADTGSPVMTLTGHSDHITGLSMINNSRLISISYDQTIIEWDLNAGSLLSQLNPNVGRLYGVASTADGTAYAAAEEGSIVKWTTEEGSEFGELNLWELPATSVATSSDGSILAASSIDGDLRVSIPGRPVLWMKAHTDEITAVAITPSHKRLVSASFDRTVKIWNLEANQAADERDDHTDIVNAIVVTPDGLSAVSASGARYISEDSTVKVWNLESGTLRFTLKGHTQGIHTLEQSPDGKEITATDYYGFEKTWNITNGIEIRSIDRRPLGMKPIVPVPSSSNLSLTIQENGQIQVLPRRPAGSVDADFSSEPIYLQNAQRIAPNQIHLSGHERHVYATRLTPDSKYAITGAEDGIVRLWELHNNTVIWSKPGHSHQINAVSITPDAHFAASVASDGSLNVWDVQKGEIIANFYGDNPLTACAISIDGRIIVTGEASGRLHFLELKD